MVRRVSELDPTYQADPNIESGVVNLRPLEAERVARIRCLGKLKKSFFAALLRAQSLPQVLTN